MGGEAAEEFVRIVLNGTEVAIRLTGSAAKNLASLLIAWSRQDQDTLSHTPLGRLLASGEELRVVSMTPEEFTSFKKEMKGKIEYAPFRNASETDGKTEVVIGRSSAPLVAHVLAGLREPQTAQKTCPEEPDKKKETPSRRGSADAENRSSLPSRANAATLPGREPDPEPVLQRLEACRTYLASPESKGNARPRVRRRERGR